MAGKMTRGLLRKGYVDPDHARTDEEMAEASKRRHEAQLPGLVANTERFIAEQAELMAQEDAAMDLSYPPPPRYAPPPLPAVLTPASVKEWRAEAYAGVRAWDMLLNRMRAVFPRVACNRGQLVGRRRIMAHEQAASEAHAAHTIALATLRSHLKAKAEKALAPYRVKDNAMKGKQE